MGGELDGIKLRDENDGGMGATMINVAMALMREVKEDVKNMSAKLDEIARERRDEAREHGGLELRMATLESSNKAVRGVSFSVGGAITVGVLIWLLKIAILHPESMPK